MDKKTTYKTLSLFLSLSHAAKRLQTPTETLSIHPHPQYQYTHRIHGYVFDSLIMNQEHHSSKPLYQTIINFHFQKKKLSQFWFLIIKIEDDQNLTETSRFSWF